MHDALIYLAMRILKKTTVMFLLALTSISLFTQRARSFHIVTNVSSRRNFGRTTTQLLGRRGSGGNKGKDGNKKTIKKSDLPSKVCVVCGRPFTWRKKWERCWDEVSTCSKRCNSERRSGARAEPSQ